MISRSIIRKGVDHPVFCEDFLYSKDSGKFFIGAVFDGCSGGNDSHFASSLFGKIAHQLLIDGIVGLSVHEAARLFLKKFVHKLFETKVLLDLNDGDMLSTFHMIIYDSVKLEALVLSVGDGVIHCDGETVILENERFKFSYPESYRDMPNYIAYDLSELGLDKTYFDIWYENNVIKHEFSDPSNISISTDGILTFNTPSEGIDPIKFLLEDDTWYLNKIMLSKKVNVLKSKYDTAHKDDLSIIRLIKEEQAVDLSTSVE